MVNRERERMRKRFGEMMWSEEGISIVGGRRDL